MSIILDRVAPEEYATITSLIVNTMGPVILHPYSGSDAYLMKLEVITYNDLGGS